MTTPRAALHVAPGPAAATDVTIPKTGHHPDPLRRLEAELQRAGGERSDGERVREEAWRLLEEAWGLVTECLVLRDGLLDACREIEHTMDAVQRRLGALPVGAEHLARERSTIAARNGARGSGGGSAP